MEKKKQVKEHIVRIRIFALTELTQKPCFKKKVVPTYRIQLTVQCLQ